jgi:KDO2-lipid IV(A) lauroyltransferase
LVPTARPTDRLRDRIALDSFRLGSALAQIIPGVVADAGASVLGVGFLAGMRDKRDIVERHLSRVQPHLRGPALSRAVHAAFDSYARYYVETFRLPSISAPRIRAGIEIDGLEHVYDGLDRGNGVILALPHLGGWEWAGRWVADQGHPITAVVEAIEPPELFEWFAGLRESLGMHVVPLGEGAGAAIIKALKANSVVCLVCDRDISGGGVPVEFFGEQTRLPSGPAALALRTGAPLLPVAVYFTRRRDGHYAIVRPPLPTHRDGTLRADVARVTQVIAHELEGLIRRSPTQWHLFQPNWPSDPGYKG